jgi:hypothetical protein
MSPSQVDRNDARFGKLSCQQGAPIYALLRDALPEAHATQDCFRALADDPPAVTGCPMEPEKPGV